MDASFFAGLGLCLDSFVMWPVRRSLRVFRRFGSV